MTEKAAGTLAGAIMDAQKAALRQAYREGVEAIGTEVFRLLGLGRSHEMYTRVDIEMMIALAVRNLRRSKGGTDG